MLAQISSRKLNEWMAYYNIEPFGEIQQEYRAGMVASTVANTSRDEKKHKDPFKADEFMRESYLDKQETEESNTSKNLMGKAMAIFGAMMGKKKG